MEAEAAGGAAAAAHAAVNDHADDAQDAEGDFDFVAEEKSRRRQAAAAAGPGPGSAGAVAAAAAAAASQRRTVLVSATLHKQLGALAELALRDPAVVGFDVKQTKSGPQLIGGADVGSGPGGSGATAGGEGEGVSYSLPASLRQTWLEVPAKERLSALAALLKSRTARRRPGGTKVRGKGAAGAAGGGGGGGTDAGASAMMASVTLSLSPGVRPTNCASPPRCSSRQLLPWTAMPIPRLPFPC